MRPIAAGTPLWCNDRHAHDHSAEGLTIALGSFFFVGAVGGCTDHAFYFRNVEFKSEPPGARFWSVGETVGYTPMTTELYRGHSPNFVPFHYTIEALPTDKCPGLPQKRDVSTANGASSVVFFDMSAKADENK